MRPPAVDAARALVLERHPHAVQAWLAGSVSRGEGTPTSDLDVTVLIEDGEVHRETLDFEGWPVELFVNTADSIDHFLAKDLARRHPTMARLVATGVPLLGDGGADVRRRCADALERGPGPVPREELELMRYGLTELLDDFADAPSGPVATAVAVGLWRETAALALAAEGAWSGSGKWLARELEALDARHGTELTAELDAALRDALHGDRGPLAAVAGRVLGRCGGRFRAGLYLAADLP
jgi:predicted nucleotidyltransferase